MCIKTANALLVKQIQLLSRTIYCYSISVLILYPEKPAHEELHDFRNRVHRVRVHAAGMQRHDSHAGARKSLPQLKREQHASQLRAAIRLPTAICSLLLEL